MTEMTLLYLCRSILNGLTNHQGQTENAPEWVFVSAPPLNEVG